MISPDPLFDAVETFFTDYLTLARGCSACTLRSYRDTLRLLLEYAGHVRSLSVDRLRIADFDAELVLDFLNHLEEKRHNRVSTRSMPDVWRASSLCRPSDTHPRRRATSILQMCSCYCATRTAALPSADAITR
jgi:hypothetical protein